MSRLTAPEPQGFDALGLEFPFSDAREDQERPDALLPRSEFGETPFAEGGFAAPEGQVPESYSGDDYDELATFEDETAGSRVSFPSGTLETTTGATGRNEEHWDPNNTGEPLLKTDPSQHAKQLSTSFTVKELVSSGGTAAPIARISPDLVRVLQAIRDHAGKAVRVTSGYRSWKRNKEVYAARRKEPTLSRHCSGQAADIKVAGLTGVDLAKLAIDAAGTDLAIGVDDNSIHVDVRGKFTVWTYFGKGSVRDKAAVAEVKEHRDCVLRGRAPISPPSPRPHEPPRPGPSRGAGRLIIRSHPHLRGHIGTPPDLILLWNDVGASGAMDVAVHFHGYSGRKKGMRIDVDKLPLSGLDFADPVSGAPGRTRPTLAVLPRGNYFGGQSGAGYNFPALVRAGALQSLVGDALARVGREVGASLRMERLILIGHSGGGAPVTAILAHTDPDEVHIFDGLYGSAANIARWAERRIARERAAPSANPPALRVFYGPGTLPHSEAVGHALRRALSAPGAETLRRRFRVERTSVAHNNIPRRFGWLLLADAGADTLGAATNEAFAEEPKTAWTSDSFGHDEHEQDVFEAGEGLASEPVEDDQHEHRNTESLTWLDVETSNPEAEEVDASNEGPDGEEMDWAEYEGFENLDEETSDGSEEFVPADENEWAQGQQAGEAEDTLILEALLDSEAEASASLFERVKGAVLFAAGPTLRRGDSGAAVAALQRALAALGAEISADGAFGPATEQAVRDFQTRSGLSVDGLVGPQTKAALAAALRGGAAPAPSPGPIPTPAPQSGDVGREIARIAEEEYRRWHPASGPFQETDAAATPILQRYYREGVNTTISSTDLQSKTWQAGHPWSAVFVSWVMQAAGARSFRGSRAHVVYVAAAKRNRLAGAHDNPFWAYRPTEVAPQIGDLVCFERSGSGVTYDNVDDGQHRASHCDVVTAIRPGFLRVVGGNVNQNVDAKENIRLLPDGRVARDGKQALIYAIVRCRGAAGGAAPPAPTPPPSPAPAPGVKLTPGQFVATYGAPARASQASHRVPASCDAWPGRARVGLGPACAALQLLRHQGAGQRPRGQPPAAAHARGALPQQRRVPRDHLDHAAAGRQVRLRGARLVPRLSRRGCRV